MSDPEYEVLASRIEDQLDGLIRIEPEHVEAKRLHKRLKKYRPELTRFLWDEQVEPTNNPAERALRPLVVARKISGGSRSTEAAEAWAQLNSVLATQEQNGKNVLEETKKTDLGLLGDGGGGKQLPSGGWIEVIPLVISIRIARHLTSYERRSHRSCECWSSLTPGRFDISSSLI